MQLNGNFGQVSQFDDLFAGGYVPVYLKNIEINSDTTLQRGMLLAETGGVYNLATSSDTGKSLAVAAVDFTPADSDDTVAQAYISGYFHKNKIITGPTDTSIIDSLELEMRRQNIILTTQHEIFDTQN